MNKSPHNLIKYFYLILTSSKCYVEKNELNE